VIVRPDGHRMGTRRWERHRAGHRLGSPATCGRGQVGVERRRDGRRRVTEPLRHDLDVHTLLKLDRRRRMAKIVKAPAGQQPSAQLGTGRDGHGLVAGLLAAAACQPTPSGGSGAELPVSSSPTSSQPASRTTPPSSPSRTPRPAPSSSPSPTPPPLIASSGSPGPLSEAGLLAQPIGEECAKDEVLARYLGEVGTYQVVCAEVADGRFFVHVDLNGARNGVPSGGYRCEPRDWGFTWSEMWMGHRLYWHCFKITDDAGVLRTPPPPATYSPTPEPTIAIQPSWEAGG